jgi:uncharacterized protein (DUF1800 family)
MAQARARNHRAVRSRRFQVIISIQPAPAAVIRMRRDGAAIMMSLTLAVSALLAGCGAGGGDATVPAPPSVAPPPIPQAVTKPQSREDASRFLQQASFGANTPSIDEVMQLGFDGWLDKQAGLPMTQHQLRVPKYDDFLTPQFVGRYPLQTSFWQAAATADDQLRQRLAYSLSQIYVVSINDMGVLRFPRGVASFHDALAKNALGSYRQLLEDVALHPVMGIYLSHLANRKEDPVTGRIPDENFAREVMQLFSIGLVQLNEDGTPRLGSNGQPVETYTNADVGGLAKVFTGFSFAAPAPEDVYFENALFPLKTDPDRDIKPMRAYPQHHSASEKRFLGAVVPANALPEQSLKIALDTLANHPNVGPFLGRQLIQKLVTSNPSPAYVARVARVFNDNGRGQRGDLRAVVQAVLLDAEARRAPTEADTQRGKIREPLLRLTAWMRAFNAQTRSGAWAWYFAGDPIDNIGQEPFAPPSVFGFFRPGYVPPGSSVAQAKLVSPEMQITGETTVAAWANQVQALASGIPRNLATLDVYSDYKAEETLAAKPEELVRHINLLLAGGTLSAQTQAIVLEAVNSVPEGSFNWAQNRARLAVHFVLLAPEFIVQQ